MRYRANVRLVGKNTAEVVQAHLEAAEGMKRPLLADVRGIRTVDREARRLATGPDVTAVTSRLAILVGNPLSRVMANFFLRVKGPEYPARLFTDEGAARAWLLQGGADSDGGKSS